MQLDEFQRLSKALVSNLLIALYFRNNFSCYCSYHSHSFTYFLNRVFISPLMMKTEFLQCFNLYLFLPPFFPFVPPFFPPFWLMKQSFKKGILLNNMPYIKITGRKEEHC